MTIYLNYLVENSMITIYPYEKLGHANHGWLNAHHHFSFASYYNPERMAFGKIRVINDDIIKPNSGFPSHPHSDMEIITYVRSGAITHKDNQGNEGRTEAGDVQVMSAGTGIFHSEYNNENEDTNIYQIWIEPDKLGVKPKWDTASFPKEVSNNKLSLLVSNDDGAALQINQNVKIYAGKLSKGGSINHKIENQAYILASEGEFEINGNLMKKGDGAEVSLLSSINIIATTDCEILVIDLPEGK